MSKDADSLLHPNAFGVGELSDLNWSTAKRIFGQTEPNCHVTYRDCLLCTICNNEEITLLDLDGSPMTEEEIFIICSELDTFDFKPGWFGP